MICRKHEIRNWIIRTVAGHTPQFLSRLVIRKLTRGTIVENRQERTQNCRERVSYQDKAADERVDINVETSPLEYINESKRVNRRKWLVWFDSILKCKIDVMQMPTVGGNGGGVNPIGKINETDRSVGTKPRATKPGFVGTRRRPWGWRKGEEMEGEGEIAFQNIHQPSASGCPSRCGTNHERAIISRNLDSDTRRDVPPKFAGSGFGGGDWFPHIESSAPGRLDLRGNPRKATSSWFCGLRKIIEHAENNDIRLIKRGLTIDNDVSFSGCRNADNSNYNIIFQS